MVTPASDPGAPCVCVAERFGATKAFMEEWNSSKWKMTGEQWRNFPAVIASCSVVSLRHFERRSKY